MIGRIKRKDQEAMVTLHARYADLLYSIAYRMLNETSSAEEVVQDVFMKAWQNAAQFDDQRGPVIAWLIGITRNLAIDHLRQRGRQIETTGDRSLEDSEEITGFNLPDDWQDRERVNSLRFAVNDLPAEQRQVIELSYFGGMSQSEIADYLALPLGTVKTRMRLGLQKLRDAWLKE
ncbi:MAG TPA: sigma-70 family RNA polymerase sigma factor [Aggregatilineales bacterium]|nr:sigma-70 family RNA polymerase sigma factor [Aggregatilineales bacterium]